jgi:hypothetical protein
MVINGALPAKPPRIWAPWANGRLPGPAPSGAAAIGADTIATVAKAALPNIKAFILFIYPPSGCEIFND